MQDPVFIYDPCSKTSEFATCTVGSDFSRLNPLARLKLYLKLNISIMPSWMH